ncbi:hypothetical protein ALMP_09310 [Streptomyces sp. A012304]|nr:hypothetical protein ALMP_09310 [Streptomyces sp. A012304]
MRAAVARAGVRMPATRVPAGRGLRCCDAKRGDSFHAPPTGLAVGFGREGLPYGLPRWGRGRFTPRSRWVPGSGRHEGAPDSAEAARPGEARRWGSHSLPGTVANWCGLCEG